MLNKHFKIYICTNKYIFMVVAAVSCCFHPHYTNRSKWFRLIITCKSQQTGEGSGGILRDVPASSLCLGNDYYLLLWVEPRSSSPALIGTWHKSSKSWWLIGNGHAGGGFIFTPPPLCGLRNHFKPIITIAPATRLKKKNKYITPILGSLPWLPFNFTVYFKQRFLLILNIC